MRKIAVTLLGLVSMLGACSTAPTPEPPPPMETARQPLPTASPTATIAPTSTATATLTPSPTATPVPTATPTPLGGGSGVALLRSCFDWPACTWAEFSLDSLQLHPLSQPFIQITQTHSEPYKTRVELIDPGSGQAMTILECPVDLYSCNHRILSGSLEEDWVFLSQNDHRAPYDGFGSTEVYRMNTDSLEVTLLDQFDGDIVGFIPFEGSSQGLMSLLWDGFRGGLFIYDLETLDRQTIISRMGEFYRFGTTPDENVFYYRITDYCETELVTREGNRVPAIKNSDGILGWIDEETFLVFTTSNNPPFCTRTGIAWANRYGITGKWVTTRPAEWAILSPDGRKVFFTSDCNSQGCTRLMVANSDGSQPELILESPEQIFQYDISGAFSPDGSQLLITAGKQIWIVRSDGSQPRLILETDDAWQVMEWPE